MLCGVPERQVYGHWLEEALDTWQGEADRAWAQGEDER
jgi:hypothetical protein